MKTRFILLNTSHAGNVGAAARAMKVMGFTDLVLVAPRWDNVLRRDETIQRASGALDVLANARVVDTLDDALDGMTHLCATAMTPRDFGPPTVEPRPHFASLVESHMNQRNFGVAFLFGSERFGMRNEDVYRCHTCLRIPTDPKFGSLNLGAAVQVLAYDWRQALGGLASMAPDGGDAGATWLETPAGSGLADAQQLAGLLAHWPTPPPAGPERRWPGDEGYEPWPRPTREHWPLRQCPFRRRASSRPRQRRFPES